MYECLPLDEAATQALELIAKLKMLHYFSDFSATNRTGLLYWQSDNF